MILNPTIDCYFLSILAVFDNLGGQDGFSRDHVASSAVMISLRILALATRRSHPVFTSFARSRHPCYKIPSHPNTVSFLFAVVKDDSDKYEMESDLSSRGMQNVMMNAKRAIVARRRGIWRHCNRKKEGSIKLRKYRHASIFCSCFHITLGIPLYMHPTRHYHLLATPSIRAAS